MDNMSCYICASSSALQCFKTHGKCKNKLKVCIKCIAMLCHEERMCPGCSQIKAQDCFQFNEYEYYQDLFEVYNQLYQMMYINQFQVLKFKSESKYSLDKIVNGQVKKFMIVLEIEQFSKKRNLTRYMDILRVLDMYVDFEWCSLYRDNPNEVFSLCANLLEYADNKDKLKDRIFLLSDSIIYSFIQTWIVVQDDPEKYREPKYTALQALLTVYSIRPDIFRKMYMLDDTIRMVQDVNLFRKASIRYRYRVDKCLYYFEKVD